MANSYLVRTPSSAGNTKKFTISAWVKRSYLGSNTATIFSSWSADSIAGHFAFRFDGSDKLDLSTWSVNVLTTNRRFRDTSAWYHIVCAVDTDESTADNRVRFYVNGVEETSFATRINPSSGQTFSVNNTNSQTVGLNNYSSGAGNMDGYMSHVAMVDGQQLTPATFGQTDSTSGIWKFKSPSGVTWGTNGFHLKFENSAALGTDSSGNSNTFTVNGNLKQSNSTPSILYPTIDVLNKYTGTNLEYGATQVAGSTGGGVKHYGTATMAVRQGKWYWEIMNKTSSNSSLAVGVCTEPAVNQRENQAPGFRQSSIATENYSGNIVINNANVSVGYGSTWTADGDICMIALDLTNNKFYIGKNGTWANSDNPSSNTGGYSLSSVTNVTGYFFPHFGSTSGTYMNSMNVNFGTGFFGITAVTSNSGAGEQDDNGQGIFQYDVPTGFYAINTKNINTYG